MIETIAAWVLLLCAAIWCVVDRIAAAIVWLDRHNAETDAQAAADHDEPSREQVEWEMHVAEAVALTQADIDALIAWDELEFAASILADIDEITGGGDAA